MKAKVIRIRTKVSRMEIDEVETDKEGGIPLETLQDAVGGLVQRVGVMRQGCESIDVWINDDGKFSGLPVNILATWLSRLWVHGDFIVGDVIVCASDGNGNSVGLTDAQVSMLTGLVVK